MRLSLSLVLFVAVSLGGGLLLGAFNTPGDWYAALEKPPFNPPGWLFGPVWTTLYVLIGVAGWRTWQSARSSTAMWLWWLQMALNFAWSPVFFTLHNIGAAFAIIIALLLTILAYIAVTWKQDRTSALLFLPYVAWVAFASLLNGSILALNS
jgi:tryptophan-rich sensory protein